MMRAKALVAFATILVLVVLGSPAVAAASTEAAVKSGNLTWQQPERTDPVRGLTSISCVSKNRCWAGDKSDRVLRWNGTAWRVEHVFSGQSRGIESVTCVPTGFCAAVQIVNRSGHAAYRPITRDTHGVWDTSSPVIKLTRQDSEVRTFPQGSLSCSSKGFCMLADQQRGYQRWNGHSWTAPARLLKASGTTLVSCRTHTSCRLVGDGLYSDGLYTWNGTRWSGRRMIDPRGLLHGLSCPTSNFCMIIRGANYITVHGSTVSEATGYAGETAIYISLSCTTPSFCLATSSDSSSIRWNGAGWGGVQRISDEGALQVSCASSSYCNAVGLIGNAVQRVNGSWQRAHPAETASGNPSDVSCGSPQLCVLVDANSAAATFDGASWTDPRHVKSFAGPHVVSCTNTSFCAAGNVLGRVQFLRNGVWSAPSLATIHPNVSAVQAISCTSSSFCAILTSSGAFRTWNGTRWFTVATPTDDYYPTALSCVAGGCVMVTQDPGTYDPVRSQTWIYRMGAHKLAKVGAPVEDFSSLSCVSMTFCMADVSAGAASETVQQFNGTSWHDAASSDGYVGGVDVSCASTTFCVTVGGGLVETTWDGTSWGVAHRILDPHVVGSRNLLEAVSCVPTLCAAMADGGWTVTAS